MQSVCRGPGHKKVVNVLSCGVLFIHSSWLALCLVLSLHRTTVVPKRHYPGALSLSFFLISPSSHHFYCPFHLFWGLCYCCRSHFLPADSNLPLSLSLCRSPLLAGKLFLLPTLLLLSYHSVLDVRSCLSAAPSLIKFRLRLSLLNCSLLYLFVCFLHSVFTASYCARSLLSLSSKWAQAAIRKNEKPNALWLFIFLNECGASFLFYKRDLFAPTATWEQTQKPPLFFVLSFFLFFCTATAV